MAGAGNTKAGGWFGAEWAATGRTMTKEQLEQEEKLHKLLVPIWISFRAKMFPGDSVIAEWWEERQLNPPLNEAANSSKESPTLETRKEEKQQYPELTMAKSKSHLRPDRDSDYEGEEEEMISQQGTTAATGLFRLAAAAMLIDSMPRLQKWKLKRELKKQGR